MNSKDSLMRPIISISELEQLKNDPNLILIDARGGAGAYENYLKRHLPGALFVDLESELSDKQPEAKNGGRHPLPSASCFCKTLSHLGVTDQSLIVVYDDKRGANAAARIWWMVRAIGHQNVAVLDGGFQAALELGSALAGKALAGEALESGAVARRASAFCYPADSWSLPTATLSEVMAASQTGQSVIVDVREAYRYRGESEPIDLVAGHIPQAINIPFVENMTTEGCFLQPTELRKKYESSFSGSKIEQVIVHCGSGVSACHTLLALEIAGLPAPRLYVGSWSEWSRNELPIAIGQEV